MPRLLIFCVAAPRNLVKLKEHFKRTNQTDRQTDRQTETPSKHDTKSHTVQPEKHSTPEDCKQMFDQYDNTSFSWEVISRSDADKRVSGVLETFDGYKLRMVHVDEVVR